jgi:hypothetical protein
MKITNEEKAVITVARAQGGNVWDEETLLPFKKRLKTHLLGKTSEQCCYCRRGFEDEFSMVIDIEHVLPKSSFPEFMFELFNLSVSCKRCNMRVKKESLVFIADRHFIRANPRNRDEYHLIHPNFDYYFDHITRLAFTVNDKKYIKYMQHTKKGKYTYEFFELEKIEIAALNYSQGIDDIGLQMNPEISADILVACQELVNKLNDA